MAKKVEGSNVKVSVDSTGGFPMKMKYRKPMIHL